MSAITSKDVLEFFANSAVDKIVLFIFFSLIVILLSNTRKDRKDFATACKALEVSINKLSTSITKHTATDEERDKKHMQEFRNLNQTLSNLMTSVNQLQTSITQLHNYCMGRNGNPSQTGGTGP